MDIATIIGAILGIGLVIGSITISGSLSAYLDLPSFLIVFGGTLASTLIHERLQHVVGAIQVALAAVFDRTGRTDEIIPAVIHLAAKARKEGLVALEGEEIEDTFLERGVQLGVDGLSPELVRLTLMNEVAALKRRHQRGQKIFKYMATISPAMGMVGTLIGLVQMLLSMSDPTTIGPSMSLALLTTLYGALLAYLLFMPISEKLGSRTDEEVMHRMLAVHGVESILRGDNPLIIQSKLEAFLAPSERKGRRKG